MFFLEKVACASLRAIHRPLNEQAGIPEATSQQEELKEWGSVVEDSLPKWWVSNFPFGPLQMLTKQSKSGFRAVLLPKAAIGRRCPLEEDF